jgi:hypothetical protein
MSDATVPVVIGTVVICVLKLALYLVDKYYPPLGAEITSIVDQITNLHAKVDAIVPVVPKPSTSIPIKVIAL